MKLFPRPYSSLSVRVCPCSSVAKKSWVKTFSSKGLAFTANKLYNSILSDGEVSERLKEHAWKACVLETVPWVRIPPSPMKRMVREPDNRDL